MKFFALLFCNCFCKTKHFCYQKNSQKQNFTKKYYRGVLTKKPIIIIRCYYMTFVLLLYDGYNKYIMAIIVLMLLLLHNGCYYSITVPIIILQLLLLN